MGSESRERHRSRSAFTPSPEPWHTITIWQWCGSIRFLVDGKVDHCGTDLFDVVRTDWGSRSCRMLLTPDGRTVERSSGCQRTDW